MSLKACSRRREEAEHPSHRGFRLLTSAATLLLLLLTGCASRSALSRFEFQRPQMGLPFRFVLYAADGHSATNAAEAAFARIAELNAILSDYEEGSELSMRSVCSSALGSLPLLA